MESKDRGSFVLHLNDQHLFPRTVIDDGGRGTRYSANSEQYILSEKGRLYTFPKHSLPYSMCTIEDLARYGFYWNYDGTKLGEVVCAYCCIRFPDFDDKALAFHEHLFRQPLCPLLTGMAINFVNFKTPDSEEKTPRLAFMDSNMGDRQLSHYFKTHPVLRTTTKKYMDFENKGECQFGRKNEEIRAMKFITSGYMKTSTVCCNDLTLYNFEPIDEKIICCKLCGLRLRNLQHGDLAGVLHFILSPHCPFFSHCFTLTTRLPNLVWTSPTYYEKTLTE